MICLRRHRGINRSIGARRSDSSQFSGISGEIDRRLTVGGEMEAMADIVYTALIVALHVDGDGGQVDFGDDGCMGTGGRGGVVVCWWWWWWWCWDGESGGAGEEECGGEDGG